MRWVTETEDEAVPVRRIVRRVEEPMVEVLPAALRLPADLLDLLPRHGRIIDLGCGAGRRCLALARQGHFGLTGVDRSEPAIECARREAERLLVRPVPEFIVADARRLPFPPDAFDAGLLEGLLTMQSGPVDRARILCQARRAIVPGGRLYVAEMAQAWHDAAYRRWYLEAAEADEIGTLAVRHPRTGEVLYRVHHFQERELVDLLAATDFEIERFRCEDIITRAGRRAEGIFLVAVNRK